MSGDALTDRDDNRGGSMSDSFTALGQTIIRATEMKINVSKPGRIVKFDPDTRLASVAVQLLTVRANRSSDDPQPTVEIADVPVILPDSGDEGMTFPIRPGLPGLLITNDRSIGKWLDEGEPVTPGLFHTHNMGDSMFIPGVIPLTDASAVDMTATVLKFEALLKLGAGAPSALVCNGVARKLDKVTNDAAMLLWMTQIAAAVTTMAAAFSAVPPGTPVLAVPAAPPVPTLPADFGVISTASTKVSAE